MNKKTNWVLMGLVGVDSGTLMIGDSCYLDNDWTSEDYDKEVCSGNWDLFKQLKGENGYLKAVLFESGFGDGIYEVWGKIKDYKKLGKRIVEVKIKLI